MRLRFAPLVVLIFSLFALQPALAQSGSLSDSYSGQELVEKGGEFFGSAAQGLASVVERAVSDLGLPNGYVLGEEAGGAFFAGVRYGEGHLHTRNAGEHKLFWQGPSLGFDIGGDGSKVMMLVYNLNAVQEVFGRFAGIEGSAYIVGGFGMTVIKRDHVVLVPIRSGIGARLGFNIGYLNITQEPTWNPF